MAEIAEIPRQISDIELKGQLEVLELSVKHWERKDLAAYFLCELEALSHMLEIASGKVLVEKEASSLLSGIKYLDASRNALDASNTPSESNQLAVDLDSDYSVGQIKGKITLLGNFRVSINGQVLHDWPGAKGRLLLIYLYLHRDTPVQKEVLMETFWPGQCPDSARNNLNVTVCRLRKYLSNYLPDESLITFDKDCYQFSSTSEFVSDLEIFQKHYAFAESFMNYGQKEQAVEEMHRALRVYNGNLLPNEPYESWLQPIRQKYQLQYLQLMERLRRHYIEVGKYSSAANLCQKALDIDDLDENSVACMLYCLYLSGKRPQAIQLFTEYSQRLSAELGIIPGQKVRHVYIAIQAGTEPDYRP